MFLSGDSALQYQVGTGGPWPINGVKNRVYGSSAVQSALTSLIQQSRTQTLENRYNRVTTRAVTAESQITNGLAGVTLSTTFHNNNSLARPAQDGGPPDSSARTSLGSKRQVFMVSLGGFDLHDNLIAQQPVLMQRVSEAMTAFYNATVELGVADKGHGVHRVRTLVARSAPTAMARTTAGAATWWSAVR